MDVSIQLPTCSACGHQIIGNATLSGDGKMYHELCWQKKANDYYFEQTLEDFTFPSESIERDDDGLDN